ncbi:MAG: DUF302 domain-containing protein [Anaerolineales bacterium]|nr:DUF302 domain-containing protein [Anaerolineales bacterium]
MITHSLGLHVHLNTDFDSAVARVTEALQAEGFGVLTEIDVKATLKKKLNVDFRPYKILGACNPPLAHRALTTAPQVGLLLPCNVVVAQAEDGSGIEVSLVDPMGMLGIIGEPGLEPIAEEARARLKRVADKLREG